MPFNPKYNAVDPTMIEGQFASGRVDQSGRLLVSSSSGSGASSGQVQGNAASGATDVGNPVKVGGVFNTTAPTLTNGQRGDLQLDSNGNLKTVDTIGVISAANSSTTPLGSSAVFTGTSVSTLNYGVIVVNVFTDVVSGTNGLSIQQSSNGTNWDITDIFTVSASSSKQVVIPVQAAFARVVYTNGAGAQATFRLQTILKPQMPTASAIKPGDAMTIENDFMATVNLPHIYNGTTMDMVREVVNGANTTGTGILATGLMAQFDDASVVATTENQFGNVRMSTDHILYAASSPTSSVGAATSTGAGSALTAALSSSLVAAGAAANLYGFNATTTSTGGYFMIFNTTSVPGDGAVVPVKVYAVGANSSIEVAYNVPVRFSGGIVMVFSTTGPFTKTASATAHMSVDYK